MPVRVYEVDRSELEALKKALVYDPYLDTTLIPAGSKNDKPSDKLTDDERKQMEEREKLVSEARKKIAESPAGKVNFSRQESNLKDGEMLGLKKNVAYLYLSAPEQFLEGAEERFKKEFKTIKRASKEEEEKVIQSVKEEEEKANAGFGSIFGG